MSKENCLLLIGNTRWHWGTQKGEKWLFSHTPPNQEKLNSPKTLLHKWAAVGNIPKHNSLKQSNRLQLREIPLFNLPEWIGIDRALAGWAAFQQATSEGVHHKGIIVADAGTIFSLTKISADGGFDGGLLVPGLNLQQKAMANSTNNLIEPKELICPKLEFPITTEEAMLKGSFQSLLSILREIKILTSMPIWLCGGDSKTIYECMKNDKENIILCPDLALEGMAKLINPKI